MELEKLVKDALKIKATVRKLEDEHLNKFKELLKVLEGRILLELEKEGLKELVVDGEGSAVLVVRKGSKKVEVDKLVKEYPIPDEILERFTKVGKDSKFIKFNLPKNEDVESQS